MGLGGRGLEKARRNPDEQLLSPHPRRRRSSPPDAVKASHGLQIHQQNEGRAVKGSVGWLADRYCSEEESPYKKLRFTTRVNYDGLIKRIVKDYGDKKLADLKRGTSRLSMMAGRHAASSQWRMAS